ncbi:MAG TPA: septal ring lytic transglycosylase RlpA family protein [Hyphomicrobiaceae bacterium]|nr:septal ring lytic transglycosylase RlpA family protein [Hyphomicrobiaceae bacterium]
MKSFVLSLVLVFAIGFAGSAPASAAISDDARETARRDRAASYQDSGTHLNRQRVARASVNDGETWGYYSERRRYSETYTQKRRYTKRSTLRTANYGKRKHYVRSKGKKHYAQRSGKKRYAKQSSKRKVAAQRSWSSGPIGSVLQGIASFYWQPQRVAAGGWFNPNAMTAAHKTLPFGTKVRVTHLGNGKSVDVRINDRGPYVAGRIIDLSKAAAGVIGMQGQGIARVKVTVLGRS